jgi:hypothetical protein
MSEESIERKRLNHEVVLPSTRGYDPASYEVTKWCQEQWGERWCPITNPTGRWACFWTGKNNPITYRHCFAHERDMTLFILRWA